jgi:gliding motility-associated lipoprotein GldD
MKKCAIFASWLTLLLSCGGNYTPKPKGYLRIDPPVARYVAFTASELPYAFAVSQLATVELPPIDSGVCWMNLDYPSLNAKLYCNYLSITPQTLNEQLEESFRLAERAAGKASAIREKMFENEAHKVYGMLFLFEGSAVSPIQFMLTDSVSHFFRGALYYQFHVNPDSIAPVTDYLQKDIAELIQTFYWKE